MQGGCRLAVDVGSVGMSMGSPFTLCYPSPPRVLELVPGPRGFDSVAVSHQHTQRGRLSEVSTDHNITGKFRLKATS